MVGADISMTKLGYHPIPTDEFLIDSLRKKVYEGVVEFKFPVIEKNLYSGEPWEVFKDDDPWDVLNPTDKATEFKRVIFVFTELKPTGKKRFLRTAGAGTWHGSTAEKPVCREDGSILIGCFKSYLDFRLSKNLKSTEEKGHWMMHEYKLRGLESMIPAPANINTVLCQITHVVNKDLGIHRVWPKSPFQICFRNFKSQGFFASRLNKRQEPSAEATDDQQVQQPKRRKSEASSSDCEKIVNKRQEPSADEQQVLYKADCEHNDIQTVATNELEIYIGYDDLKGFNYTFQLALPHPTDDMQIMLNSQDSLTQMVVNGNEDVFMGTRTLEASDCKQIVNKRQEPCADEQQVMYTAEYEQMNNDHQLVLPNSTNNLDDDLKGFLDTFQLPLSNSTDDMQNNLDDVVVNSEEYLMQWLDCGNERFDAEDIGDIPPMYKMHITLPWED